MEHTRVKPLTRDARVRAVAKVFEEGEAQLARDRADARLMSLGSGAGWRGYTVVFEGLECVHFRAPSQPKRKLLASRG